MAFLLAAPEVAGAAEAATGAGEAAEGAGAAKSSAGARGRGRKGKGKAGKGGAGRQPITSDMTPEEVQAELDARRERRAAGDRSDVAGSQPESSSSSSSKPAAPLFVMPQADKWHTGSGLVLGAVGWVLFMNFMQGGMPQVRRWGAAKFLNRTPQVGGTK